MQIMNLTSQITFLYFEDLIKANQFLNDTLGLEKVYDPGWACVYRTGQQAFLGAVQANAGSIQVTNRGGVLISLTVSNIEEVHAHLAEAGYNPSPVKQVKDLALQSFFFTGPEGYPFEVEQFTSGSLSKLF